jgi:hypothetical protein
MHLYDGTVTPSWMSVNSGPPPSGAELAMNDPYLRIGRVVRAHYPGEETNANGTATEYDVEVEYVDINGAHTRQVYPRCQIASLFGGIADQVRFTPRKKTTQRADEDDDEGSLVLLLCINGNSRAGVIMGGLDHPAATKDAKDDGHNLKFSFNGISFEINKDGELTLTYKGATKSDGELSDDADEDASGSKVAFTKDGSVEISTADDNQHIRLNHADKKLDIKTDAELHIEVTGGNVNIESDGTHIGGENASEALVMGSTYRQNESQMHQQMQTALAALAGMVQSAGVTISAAAASNPLLAGLAGAGAALTTAGAKVAELQTAISTFEASASQYLSQKNTTD